MGGDGDGRRETGGGGVYSVMGRERGDRRPAVVAGRAAVETSGGGERGRRWRWVGAALQVW